MDISEIALSAIADTYLAFIKENRQILFIDLIGFIDIASRLIVLKTRLLLPYLKNNKDEDDDENLVQDIILYKQYKEAATRLLAVWNSPNFLFSAQPNLKKILSEMHATSSESELVQVSCLEQRFGGFLFTTEMLAVSMRRIVKNNNYEFKAVLPVKRFMNIQEALQRINDFLDRNKKAVFSEIAAAVFVKADIIAHFLAILELFKKQEVYILQDLPLGEIVIEKMG